jgi:hypothetical protein
MLVEVEPEPDASEVRRQVWQLEEDRALLREARNAQVYPQDPS